jgi:hypothetical protein
VTETSELRDRAVHRLDILARQLDRLTPDDLRRIGFRLDPSAGKDLRTRTEDAIVAAGLGAILEDARQRFRDAVLGLFNQTGPSPSWVGTWWGSSAGSVDDRVGVVRAVDDAVLATIAHDLISEDDRRALSERYSVLVGMRRG